MPYADPGNRRAYRRARTERHTAHIQGVKLRSGCLRCGFSDDPAKLNFHHRDPATKRKNVGQMECYSRAAVDAEIAKCDVLCDGCHIIVEPRR